MYEVLTLIQLIRFMKANAIIIRIYEFIIKIININNLNIKLK